MSDESPAVTGLIELTHDAWAKLKAPRVTPFAYAGAKVMNGWLENQHMTEAAFDEGVHKFMTHPFVDANDPRSLSITLSKGEG